MDGDVVLILAAIALLSGFIHSAIGFGFGIVAISLIPFVIDTRSAHIVVSVSSVPMLVMAAWAYRRGMDWASAKQALLGAAIFLPLGLWLFETVSLDWLARGTGIGILAAVLFSLRTASLHSSRPTSPAACFIAGALAGFLAGAVSIAGPPIAAFALKQDWSQSRFKSFVTECLLVIATYKAALLVVRGHFAGQAIWHTAVTAVVAIVGVQLGVLASRRISATRFKRLVALALIMVSCLMIWRGSGKKQKIEIRGTKSEINSHLEVPRGETRGSFPSPGSGGFSPDSLP